MRGQLEIRSLVLGTLLAVISAGSLVAFSLIAERAGTPRSEGVTPALPAWVVPDVFVGSAPTPNSDRAGDGDPRPDLPTVADDGDEVLGTQFDQGRRSSDDEPNRDKNKNEDKNENKDKDKGKDDNGVNHPGNRHTDNDNSPPYGHAYGHDKNGDRGKARGHSKTPRVARERGPGKSHSPTSSKSHPSSNGSGHGHPSSNGKAYGKKKN